jgi:hypothetical protein
MRPWLGAGRSLDRLNEQAEARGLRTESGRPIRFVPPASVDRYYEVSVYETGRVATRTESLHDWFNALAWLAFPRTKARINAMHAAEMPRERERSGGRRGRLRDLLTIFDEGGALVACDDAELIALLRGFRWKELFWEQRSRVRASMRFLVLGHAVLEQALEPRPDITCKVVFVGSRADPDVQAADWLASLPAAATPRDLAPLPVFGYPGWLPENAGAEFYDDTRVFRRPGVK